MLLSKKLTFYFVFSVLLIAALAFVVTPAMAQETVSYYATGTVGADATTAGSWVVTFKFDMGGSFPGTDVFTSFNTDDPPVKQYNISLGGTALTEEQFGAVTYADNTLTVSVPAADPPTDPLPNLSFTVQGYDAATISADIAEADAVDLAVASAHLAGKAYRVYTRFGVTPQLRTGVAAVTAASEADDTFPDNLEEFFVVNGGTINLNLTNAAANGATAITANSRHIIINEIMWAVDDRLVGQAGYENQQWIEVYNTTSIPVPDAGISFEFIDDTFPAPAIEDGTSDRLSNIHGFQNVWSLVGSSSGTSTLVGGTGADATNINGANPPFASMYRSNYGGDHPEGWRADNWKASTRAYFPGFLGTPGGANTRGGLPETRDDPTPFTPPKDKIIINEVGNYEDNTLDWIELRNVSDAAVNIKNWRLNYTDGTTDYTEENIVQFADKDTNIPAGEVLLIVNKDPKDTDLIAGQDIREGDQNNQQLGAGPHKYLNIKRSDAKDLHIPEITAGFLILRNHGDNKFKGGRQHLHDAVGTSRVSRNTIASGVKEPESGDTYWKTDAWPINGHTGDNYRAHNADKSDNNNASLDPAANFADGTVWARSGTNHGWRKGGGGHAGFSGGVGYDRGIKGNGTPGYPNDVVKNKVDTLDGGKVIITELMLTTDGNRYPQWIELFNNSAVGVDLGANTDGDGGRDGWTIDIENYDSGSWKTENRPLIISLKFNQLGDIRYIPPYQTVLITARTARNFAADNAEAFPSHRVTGVWQVQAARNAFKMENQKDQFLNIEGFHIKLVDGNGVTSDEVGNLDGKASGRGEELDEPGPWLWPTKLTEDGDRSSLIRLKNQDGTFRTGVPKRDDDGNLVEGDMTGQPLPMGIARDRRGMGRMIMDADGNDVIVPAKYSGAAWIHASDTELADAKETWYGSGDDQGTPGHTAGTPLPVELSHFRPTLENGQVVIRWTTESELDNAGFNILRSDTRDGEYKQVNAKLIQGHGTTGERHTYKWIDESAKPNVVYYYQIEDVSFAGERQTLQTTKLKGLISARGKATTTWGDIKEVQ